MEKCELITLYINFNKIYSQNYLSPYDCLSYFLIKKLKINNLANKYKRIYIFIII